jgi:hypothetical protein
MALNITFTCNEVVDENNNPINCKYQVYYPEYGVWNDVRDTELFQYNCNAGDGDSLTQTGTFLSGDHAIVVLWVGGNDRSGLKDRMAYHVITHDGVTNTYVLDVQLKPKTAPSCSWYLSTSATINREKTAYSYASDDYSYNFGGVTHYHHRQYGSEIIFPSIGDLVITFDFDEGDGFASTNKHTYSVIGDYVAKHKAVNQYSLESICERNIRLKYNTPIGCLSFTPDGVGSGDEVQKGDTVTTTACITDEDSRITNIAHHWIIKDRSNNSNIIRDTKIADNTNLSFSYNKELLELHDTFGYQYITWNDGWADYTITKYREIQVKNINPEVSISKIDLSAKEKRFVQESSDADGTVTSWTWKIYLLMPFSGDWVEVHSTTTDGSPIEIMFNEAGRYKTEVIVEDDFRKYSTTNTTYAGYASTEIEFDISASGTCTTGGALQDDVFFIFPDVVGDGINIT